MTTATVLSVAKMIDDDAWRAVEDGRETPDSLWHLRREWAINKAEAIVRFLAGKELA